MAVVTLAVNNIKLNTCIAFIQGSDIPETVRIGDVLKTPNGESTILEIGMPSGDPSQMKDGLDICVPCGTLNEGDIVEFMN